MTTNSPVAAKQEEKCWHPGKQRKLNVTTALRWVGDFRPLECDPSSLYSEEGILVVEPIPFRCNL